MKGTSNDRRNEREREQKSSHLDNKGKKNYLQTNYAHKKFSNQYDFKLIRYILELGEINSGENVLDLGCGTGSFKSVFEASNFTYYGVDIDNNDELNNIQKCDMASQSLPFEDNSYDLIFFKMVIEHLTIEEISNCLSEAIRVLKPKGNLIVITPDWKWTYKFFYEEYTHQTPFTSSSLTSALKMAQFEVKYCQTLIQLPIIWKFPFLKVIANVACMLYPMTHKKNKFIKFSQERALLAIANKP